MDKDIEIVSIIKSIFYDNYYKHFLLSNLPNVDDLYVPPSAFKFNGTTNRSDRIEIPDIQCYLVAAAGTCTASHDKSYVVFGDGGTGKTSLALSIVQKCWKNKLAEQVIIPIYIYLPQLLRLRRQYCRSENVLSLFIKMHFSQFKQVKSDINETDILNVLVTSNKYQLLLVLDGYENFVDIKRNLWEQNGFEEYVNLKTIIFCRPEALSDSKFDKTFSYKMHDTILAKYHFLLPFTSVQISSYLLKVVAFLRNLDSASFESNDQMIQLNEPWIVTKEITKVNQIWERDSSEYRHWFQLILPELGEISQTPFLLSLLVQVLPTIVEEYRLKPNQSSFDMELVQLVSTEVGIYDHFTRKCFDYSAKKIVQIHPKLKEVEDSLPRLLEIYSQNLALRLFNGKQGFVGDRKFSRKITEEWDLWKSNENCTPEEKQFGATEKFSSLFPNSERDSDIEKMGHLVAIRSGCLLRYFHFQSQGENYMFLFQFLHASLLEYFVSRTIFKGLRAELNFHLKQVGVQSTQFSFSFESIRSSKYVGILHMLVERARIDLDFKSLLLSVVHSSKEIFSLGLMSSNAFTILTQAYRVWSNEDFSHVNIADADMSHCIFTNCKFNGADMSRVLLTGTYFYKSHLKAANLFNSHISGGFNFDLQEGIPPLKKKHVMHFQVVENEDNNKPYIAYLSAWTGLSDLYLFDVNKRKSELIIRSPKWFVKEFRKIQLNQNVFLAVLKSREKSDLGQTIGIFDLKNKSKIVYFNQKYLTQQQEASHTKNLNLFADGDTTVLDIFTVSIPNYDVKVVCYRTPTEDEGRIVASSHFLSLTMSHYTFSFSIRSNKGIKLLSLYQSMTSSTLLATSCEEYVTLFDLQDERVLFQKAKCQPKHKGQVVLTFLQFSPDGKYLLFDMGESLYILTLEYNDVDGKCLTVSSTEVSLLGSKGGYSNLNDFDFSTEIQNQPLVALVFSNETPLVINVATGQKLQSIKMRNNCMTMRFNIRRDNQLQLIGASIFGSLSSRNIHSNLTGDPRSIQALNPRTDFHSLIDTNMELVKSFVSLKGEYMSVVKHQKHRFTNVGEERGDIIFWLLLFKIDGNSGKRTFVFNYSFSTSPINDIHVFFINEKFLCLTYSNVFKQFKCEPLPYLGDNNCVKPFTVQTAPIISTNFQKCWYHEHSQQIVIQRTDSIILEVYLIEIDRDCSLHFHLKWQNDFRYSAANVIFYVNESDNCAYVFPLGQSCCFIWNLNSGGMLTLSTNIVELSYKLEDIKHVSTVWAVNGLPILLFADFSKGSSGSFTGQIDHDHKTLTLSKIEERVVFQPIEFTNCFLAFYRIIYVTSDSFRHCFSFGTYPRIKTMILTINPIHNVDGFLLTPVTTNLENVRIVRLLAWDKRSISCFEVDLSAMAEWKGENDKFTGWRLLWCDPPNDQFSLLYSNAMNSVVGKDEDWDFITKQFDCEGRVERRVSSFISLSSLYEQVHENPQSIFSKKKDFILSENMWILFVIAKKKNFLSSRLAQIDVLDGHSGIIIEGLRHGRHFAFRADLFINPDKTYAITVAPLKRKKDKYLKLHKHYLATEFEISSDQGKLIIDKILADKQSEIDYHLRYQNCNSWVKCLLSLIGIEVERKWSFADMSNDFFKKKKGKVLNFPALTATSMKS